LKTLFLDTSAYSFFKRGHPVVLEAIRHADRLYLNTIVLGELFSGFDRGKYRSQNRKELKEFLSHHSVKVFSLTEETAERYSFIYGALASAGTPIPTNDLWISASVVESGSILLTSDAHFLKVKQIQTLFFDAKKG